MIKSCSTVTLTKRVIPKKIKKWWCSSCRKRSSVRIVFGYPIYDVFEAAERGEFWLGGCLPSSCEFPLTHCLACGHEDLVKYETKKSLFRVPTSLSDRLIRRNETAIREPEDEMLKQLKSEIILWEISVSYLEKGNDASEEYTYDIYSRHCLQEVLDEFIHHNLPVPDELNSRITVADKRFIDATIELVDGKNFWGDHECYDHKVFWYYYRSPIK